MTTQSKHWNIQHTLYASYLGYITQAIVNNLAPLLFVTFQKEWDISLEKIALLISINFIIQIITDFVAAYYVDRIGYRPLIIVAHLLAFVGLVGLGVFPYLFDYLCSSPYAGLLFAILLYAIGGGLIEVLVSPIVEALPNGDQKAKAMSLLHSFYCWGHVLVVLGSTLFFITVGIQYWYLLTIFWSLLPLLNSILFAKVPIYQLGAHEDTIPLSQFVKTKLFWLFVLLMIFAGASEQAMSQWASFFAESGLQVSKTLGDLFGPCAFAILMGLSRLFYGKYGHRIPLKNFMLFSSFLCICSYILTVTASSPVISLVGCALTGLSVGVMWPGTFSLAAKTCPGGGTAMFAFFALAGDLGCAAGPSLVGALSGLTSLTFGLSIAIIFPLGMAIGLCFLRKKSVETSDTNYLHN